MPPPLLLIAVGGLAYKGISYAFDSEEEHDNEQSQSEPTDDEDDNIEQEEQTGEVSSTEEHQIPAPALSRLHGFSLIESQPPTINIPPSAGKATMASFTMSWFTSEPDAASGPALTSNSESQLRSWFTSEPSAASEPVLPSNSESSFFGSWFTSEDSFKGTAEKSQLVDIPLKPVRSDSVPAEPSILPGQSQSWTVVDIVT